MTFSYCTFGLLTIISFIFRISIKKGLLAKVSLSSPVAQVLVHTALAWRTFAVKYGLDTPLFNALVFKKFKKAVGGNLIWALSGGGPLNGEVQEFIRVAFNLPLIQGYGLTETCAGLSIQAEDDDRPGIAGVIIPSCEVKVISTPDVCDKGGIPYMSTVSMDYLRLCGQLWHASLFSFHLELHSTGPQRCRRQ